jgi:hypothetical protein
VHLAVGNADKRGDIAMEVEQRVHLVWRQLLFPVNDNYLPPRCLGWVADGEE